MWRPDEDDAARDGLALVSCAHFGDLEGARAILANANVRLVCAFLARLGADLLEDLTDSPDEALALLREHHAGS
jgi:hypothetical protein